MTETDNHSFDPLLARVVKIKVAGPDGSSQSPAPRSSVLGSQPPSRCQGAGWSATPKPRTSPVSGNASGRIAVQVTTPPAREDADWRGLSGSGVVDAQERLAGVGAME